MEGIRRIDDARLRAYLRRLGVDQAPEPTLGTLGALHVAHLERIPFENLSIHLGETITLEHDALVAKLVDRGRGGFCYELNGAFAWLLEQLGFRVTMLAARVVDGDKLGPPFDHMCLRVDLDEPWLADVGFGDNFALPLRLDGRDEQSDVRGKFRIVDASDNQLDLLRDGKPQYRFDLEPHVLGDYAETCIYQQTSPESHFTKNTVCSRATSDGRLTISGHTLIVTQGAERTEWTLSDAELLESYRDLFGIDLPDLPAIDRSAAVDQ